MFVQMNSVVISFKSLEFQASVQISRLIVESTTPQWKPDDLRSTRIKDEGRGEVLTFKDIHWSTLRIDANAVASVSIQLCKIPVKLPFRGNTMRVYHIISKFIDRKSSLKLVKM